MCPHYHHPRGSWLEDRIPIATKGGKTAAGKDQIIHYTQQEEGKSFFYNSLIQFGGDSEAGNLRTQWKTHSEEDPSEVTSYYHKKRAIPELQLLWSVTHANYHLKTRNSPFSAKTCLGCKGFRMDSEWWVKTFFPLGPEFAGRWHYDSVR